MSIDSSNSLVCNKDKPDANCMFEVIPDSPSIMGVKFKGANGLLIAQFYGDDGWFRCEDPPYLGHPFDPIHVKGNEFYFYTRYVNDHEYITNRRHPKYDGLAASPYANDDCLFTVSEPIISKEIHDVVYDLPKAVMADVSPLIALSTTVRNDSKTSDISRTLPYSYTRSKVGTWNNAAGVEIGAEPSFSAGVPFIESVDLKISVTPSYSHKWGGSEGTEETISSSTEITIPAGKKGEVDVLVKRKKLDVSFTYKETIIYKDGKTKTNDKKGVYDNIESYTVDVQVGDWKDI